jgi:hypothetical protein
MLHCTKNAQNDFIAEFIVANRRPSSDEATAAQIGKGLKFQRDCDLPIKLARSLLF